MRITRTCTNCHATKTIDQFEAPNGGLYRTCATCRKRSMLNKRRYKLNEEIKENKQNLKVCTKCGKEKPLLAFLPGFDHCRECQRERRVNDG